MKLFFCLINTRNIFECGSIFRFTKSGSAFSERHGFAATGLHLAHKKDPDSQQQKHGEPGDKNTHIPAGLFRSYHYNPDIFLSQCPNQIRVFWRSRGLKGLAVHILAGDTIATDHYLVNLPLFNLIHKLTKNHFGLNDYRLIKYIEQSNQDYADHQPES